MGHPRMEVQGVIQQLRDAMGQEKGTLYWDALRRFLLSKLSKREFDHIVLQQLGPENIGLHNRLIQVVLVNAQSGRPAPTTQLSIFQRTEHKKRPRVMLKQKKHNVLHKHKHREHRTCKTDGDSHKRFRHLSHDEQTKEHKRKRRALLNPHEGRDTSSHEHSLGDERKKERRGVLKSPSQNHVRASSTMRPRHTYTDMVELEPTEVAYEVRQHVASIGMGVTQESVDYLRYAMQEYVNRILDACRAVKNDNPGQHNGVITMPDLHNATDELRQLFPPWIISKLFEQSLVATPLVDDRVRDQR